MKPTGKRPLMHLMAASALMAGPTVLPQPESASPLKHLRTAHVDDNAWPRFNMASFDQDKIVSRGNYQYTPYWDADKVLVVVRRRLGDTSVQAVRLPQYTLTINPNDGHRNTVVGISPGDGRLHLSWDHHCNPLRYTRSKPGLITDPPAELEAGDFEPAQPLMPKDRLASRVTYPRFLNDGTGRLFFIYRQGSSGRGDNYIHRYDQDTGRWQRMGATGLFSRRGTYPGWQNSTSRNAYLNDVLFDKQSRLHVTWTYRETGRTWASNHDLHYAWSTDGGTVWNNNAGEKIADLATGDAIELADRGLVVREIPVFSWLMNQTTMVIDSRNQPHVITYKLAAPFQPDVLKHDPPADAAAKLHMFHYWRSPDGAWHGGRPIVPLRCRPGVVVDEHDNLVVYYARQGKLVVHSARARESWAEWATCNVEVPGVKLVAAGKPDRLQARAASLLSFACVTKTGPATRGFAIVDFQVVLP